MLAHFGGGFLGDGGELARFDLVGLGEHDAVADRGFIEHLHHHPVDVLEAVAAVDQHQRAGQHLPPAQVGIDQRLPLVDHLDRRLGKAVAGHIDQPEQRQCALFLRPADIEEIELLRAPRGHRSARNRLAAGQRVQERGLAHVRTPAKGDLRHLRIGQEMELRRGLEEIDRPRKELRCRLLARGGIVRVGHAPNSSPLACLPPRWRPSIADAWNRDSSAAPA